MLRPALIFDVCEPLRNSARLCGGAARKGAGSVGQSPRAGSQGITRMGSAVRLVMESSHLVPACLVPAGHEEISTIIQWHVPGLLSQEKIVLVLAPTALTLKLVILVSPHMTLMNFEVLSLH